MNSEAPPASKVIEASVRLPAMSRIVCTMSARPRTARGGGGDALAELRAVGRLPQPHQQRQVEERVGDQAPDRAQHQQEARADGRTGQQAQPAGGGIQPHRALQQLRADDVVDQHLARRRPEHAGKAVQHQQRHRVPHLQRVGEEEVGPAQRRGDEQQHADLDQAPRIEAVGQRAGPHREEQERHPVRDHREAGQLGRCELLVHHPVADHVLDAVRHHRQCVGDEVDAIARMMQGCKGACSRGDWRGWRNLRNWRGWRVAQGMLKASELSARRPESATGVAVGLGGRGWRSWLTANTGFPAEATPLEQKK